MSDNQSEFEVHAPRHVSGGDLEIDGDRLDVDYSPTRYTPDVSPPQVTSISELTAHLAGIDGVLGPAGADTQVQFNAAGLFGADSDFVWDNVNKILGIGTTNPSTKSILDLTSTTKGFLPPRMTNTQRDAIASPVAGLLLYDTTNNSLNVYNSSSWRSMVATPASTLTPGSVIYATGVCDVDDDNASFFWDITNKRLGVGTNTPSTALDISGDAHITGNLIVDGTVILVNSETVNIADNHLYLNAGYTPAISETGGLVVNYLPTSTADSVSAGAFVAGVAAVSNPTVTTVGVTTFSVGDIIQISGSNLGENDGIFEVLSHVSNLLTIRGIGLTASVEDFTQNQFVANASDSATITKITVSVLRSGVDGQWEAATGSVTGFVFSDFAVQNATLIEGSVLFADANGNVSQDNASFFWDDTNNSLGIGPNTPVASSILELSSTAKGFLPPRMTSTQRDAITTPAEGLVIYDLTNNKPDFYNGTAWKAFVATNASTFVSGSVIFADGAHHVNDDNANFFWDNTNKRLGIGTDTPSVKLHIYGAGDQSVNIESSDDNQAIVNLRSNGIRKGLMGYNETADLFVITHREAGTNKSNFDLVVKEGSVGIGTDSPGLPLEVRSADDNQVFCFDSRAQAQGVGGGIAFGGKYTDAGAEAMAGRIGTTKTNGTSGHVGFDMVFQTQNSVGSITERAIFTSDAKCGIGDVVPLATLDVNGDTRIRGDLTLVDNISMTGNLTSDGNLYSVNVEASGNVGAGKSSPNFRIDAYINRISGIVRSARFQTDGNHVDARGLYVLAGEDTESGTNYWFEAVDGNGGATTGGLRSVSGVFDVYDASDERLKQNIEDTDTVGKDIVLGLKVRDFEWKRNPGRKVTGFVAQEVLEIYPDAVGDPDPETGMYGVSKSVLIPHLIKHNQEQHAEIEALKSRVAKLERIS